VFNLVGTTLEGRFDVDLVVAEGGFGVVYHALQAALERPIALKVLKTPRRFDEAEMEEFLESFAREAKTIARIAHPNIVHVYDFGVSMMPSGVRAAWMALEWITGSTLEQELLRRRGRAGRSPSECFAILKPVLSALAVVHESGIAHRDLKPANIMLVPNRGGFSLKLFDFGIAKIMHADEGPGSGKTQTRSNQIAFSPGYASPEQVSNGRTGPWTDVHAMGLILTEMLTDRPPLEGREMPLLFQQIVDRVRPTPGKFGVEVGAWEEVIRRALSLASAERYRDAGELLRALEATVSEASAAHVSRPPSPPPAPALSGPTRFAETLDRGSPAQAFLDGAVTPAPPQVTTNGAMSGAEPRAQPNRQRQVPIYLVGGALIAAVAVGIGWRGTARRSQLPGAARSVTEEAANVPPSPPSASEAPGPPPGAPSVEALPVASTATIVVPAGSGRRPPSRAAGAAAPRASPSAATSAGSYGKLIIE